MIKNLKDYVTDLGKVIVYGSVPNMREAINQLVNHAEEAEKQMNVLRESYNEAHKTKHEAVHEMEGLAKQLDRYAIKLFKDRNQEPPVQPTESQIVAIEEFLMDKAQQIRTFLLMRDLV